MDDPADMKLLNMQLRMQYMEEELSLYRNGTDGAQLLDMIKERDENIENLKKELIEADNKFIVCIEKLKELVTEKETVEKENEKLLEDQIRQSEDQNKAAEDFQQREKYFNEIITSLQSSVQQKSETIESLHKRCSDLVQEKHDLNKKLKTSQYEHETLIKKYRAEVEKGINANEQIKSRCRGEQDLSSKLSEDLQRLKEEYKTLASENASLKRHQTEQNEFERVLKAKYDQLKHDHVSAVDKLKSLENALSSKDSMIHNMQNEIHALSNQCMELDSIAQLQQNRLAMFENGSNQQLNIPTVFHPGVSMSGKENETTVYGSTKPPLSGATGNATKKGIAHKKGLKPGAPINMYNM